MIDFEKMKRDVVRIFQYYANYDFEVSVEYAGSEAVRVTVIQEQEYVPLNYLHLAKLAVVFETKNFVVDSDSPAYDVYRHEFVFRMKDQEVLTR